LLHEAFFHDPGEASNITAILALSPFEGLSGLEFRVYVALDRLKAEIQTNLGFPGNARA
jgi:hypothetical protein